jgi:predicted regulator of Ras-like GTPase activity (Roadblock/LC7/MglB family)
MTRSAAAIQNMSWLLTNFADHVSGIAHVVAVSADGLLLASSQGLPEDRADQLAAIAAGVVSLTDGTSRYFNGGSVLQTIIEMDGGYLFLMSISDGSCLAVLASRNCDVGQVGYEMALLVERVGQALSPAPRQGVPQGMPQGVAPGR